jgi:response regulator of citrate/malate metabolism
MPLLMRRRPLLRAAAVGGGAYYAGKRTAQSRQQAATQDQRLDDLEAQQSEPAAPAPAPSAGITSEAMQKLQELAKLHEQEILTDDEFAQQKQRLLAG